MSNRSKKDKPAHARLPWIILKVLDVPGLIYQIEIQSALKKEKGKGRKSKKRRRN